MYNYSQKKPYLAEDKPYSKHLQAIFNNSMYMEQKYGDISDWITPQYAEYCARNFIFSQKNLRNFKTPLKMGYFRPMGKLSYELDELDIDKVYKAAKDYNIKAYWFTASELLQTIRNTLDQEAMCGIFARNTVTTASLLLYCGLSFNELEAIKRDDVLSKGIWSVNFPTKIERQTLESQFIMQYAQQGLDLMPEYMTGLQLVRGGKSGRNSFSFGSYQRTIFLMNGKSEYDISIKNIILSGEFRRIYEKYGTDIKEPEIFQPICQNKDVKIKDKKEIQNLYRLFCILKK